MSTLAERLRDVHNRIESACSQAGRSASDVELIVITKNHPAALVLDLARLGQDQFGENRDQEASAKAKEVAKELGAEQAVWHFVGQLQSNKVRSVLEYASFIHSLDRPSLLTELAKQLAKTPEKTIGVFVELNLTDDQNRGGIQPSNLLEFAESVLAISQLNLLGVMGVASLEKAAEHDFELIAKASDSLRSLNPGSRYISAGMSGDFETAIVFGATHIRVGTAITGKRA